MGVHQYFKRLSDLEKLIRLPGKFKYFEHNVAAHSFKVNKITKIHGKKAAKVYHIIIFTHFVFVVLRLTLLFHVVQHEE